jgi:hypothetical protein
MRLTDDIPTIEQLVASTTAFLQLIGHEKVRQQQQPLASIATNSNQNLGNVVAQIIVPGFSSVQQGLPAAPAA